MLDEREGPVSTAELNRSFNRKPLSSRALIVAAGPGGELSSWPCFTGSLADWAARIWIL